MAFPPQFLDEIRARLSLSSLVGRKVKLVRAGREWKSPCPFHKEKTPSFYVNDAKGFFHCFGCGAHGDAVGFVMRHDNLSFLEAVELLASEAGLEVPKPTETERRRYEVEKTHHEILEAATSWFEGQLRLPAGRRALDYLRGRGLDDAAISSFRLGYAPADAQALKAALLGPGVTEQDLVDLSLLRRAEDGSRTYAFFRDRVIFPVGDRRGRTIAFGARLIEGEGPKYVNSSEHPLFHKGETLYGLARARQAAADGQHLIVAEGYMDVIALARAGFPGAVAPMGTALTEAQIEALWRLIPGGLRAPILCLDGDAAGQRAAARAVDRVLPLLKPDHTLRIAFMPPGEDPDSLIRGGGAAAMAKVLHNAIPLSEMVWRASLETTSRDTPEQIAGFQEHLFSRVAAIGDRAVQYQYRQFFMKKLRETFTAPFRTRTKAFAKGSRGKNGFTAPIGPAPTNLPMVTVDIKAKTLLLVLLYNPSLFHEFEEQILTYPMAEDVKPLAEAFFRLCSESTDFTDLDMFETLGGQGFADSFPLLIMPRVKLHAAFAKAGAAVEKVRHGLHEILHAEHDGLHADMRRILAKFPEISEADYEKYCLLHARLVEVRSRSFEG